MYLKHNHFSDLRFNKIVRKVKYILSTMFVKNILIPTKIFSENGLNMYILLFKTMLCNFHEKSFVQWSERFIRKFSINKIQ